MCRHYLSSVDPDEEVDYECSILDSGDGPSFQIVAADMPGHRTVAKTASEAWEKIVHNANLIRGNRLPETVSGIELFGLGHNTTKYLIQELPGVDQLKGYEGQAFVEGIGLPSVPRDRNTKQPKLPLTVGGVTVVKLGEVSEREGFHTQRYIFPIGYKARRYVRTTSVVAYSIC